MGLKLVEKSGTSYHDHTILMPNENVAAISRSRLRPDGRLSKLKIGERTQRANGQALELTKTDGSTPTIPGWVLVLSLTPREVVA